MLRRVRIAASLLLITLVALGFSHGNFIKNYTPNPVMAGIVAGTPGTPPTENDFYLPDIPSTGNHGVSVTIVGSGVDASGISYFDFRVFGTYDGNGPGGPSRGYAQPGFSPSTITTGVIPASNGQTFTMSIYLQIVAGSWSGFTHSGAGVFLEVDSYDVGGNFLNPYFTQSIAPAGTSIALNQQQYTMTQTFTDATTALAWPHLSIEYLTGQAVDATLRIGYPQYQLGTIATKPY